MNYENLKALVNAKVYENTEQEITGEGLNEVLQSIVASLGVGYQFVGIATPATNPGTPDQKIFYIANGKGAYANFGGLSITEDDVVILYYDTTWHKSNTGIASYEDLLPALIDLGLTPVKTFNVQPLNSYPCDFISGHTYTIKNLGNIGVNVSTRNSPDGAIIDNLGHVSSQDEKTFVATQNAAYLRLGVAESQGLINLSVQDTTAPSGNIGKAIEEANTSLRKIGNGETTTFIPVANTSQEYEFTKEHIYRVEYIAPSFNPDIVISTRNTPNGDIVDLVGSIYSKGIKTFKATANAHYIRFNATVQNNSLVKVTDITAIDYGKIILDSLMPNIEDTPFYFQDAGVMQYKFKRDCVYIITNSSAASIRVSTRNTPDGAVIDGIWTIPAGSSKYVKTTNDAEYLRCADAGYGTINSLRTNDDLVKRLDVLNTDSLTYENGSIDSAGFFVERKTRIRTANNIYGNKLIVAPDGLKIFRFVYYDISSGLFDSIISVNERVSIVGKNGCYARIVFCSDTNEDLEINYKDYVQFGSNSFLQEQINANYDKIKPSIAPFVNFDLSDSSLLDMSDELNGMDFKAVDSLGCRTYIEQIYAKFDALCNNYPEYITKIDAAQFVGIDYPTYANLNGQAQGNYDATPSYKMYMYKLSTYDKNANSGVNAKRKVFIAAGLHGWEHASQWNTFIIASKLCKLANENYFALRSCYDFYFVPCVNGYGAYHYTRQNANGVDLNRNFPNPYWTKSGKPWDYGYTGENAASEFETQVIMALVDSIKPDIAIDHHSYGAANYNFYIETNSNETFQISHNVLTKFANKCISEYPQYYGSKFGFRSNLFNYINRVDTEFTLNRWLYWYKKSKISATWEVCLCIAYLNNVSDSATAEATYMGEDIVKLNEYMVRHLLMAYYSLIG